MRPLRPLLPLLFFLFASSASSFASTPPPLGALPIGTWASAPNVHISVPPEPFTQLYVQTLTLTSTEGTDFSLAVSLGTSPNSLTPFIKLAFNGSAVCSTSDKQLIISLDSSTCHQYGSTRPDMCGYAVELFAGEFSYGVSAQDGGTLIIYEWSGANYPIVLSCFPSSSSCAYSVACNITIVSQFFVTLNGGSLNATNSFVTLYNSTSQFNGDQITITDSSQVTLASNTTNQTVIVDGTGNTVNITSPTLQVTLNNYCAKNCNSWMTYGNTQLTDQSITNVYAPLLLSASASVSLADDALLPYWVVTGPLITYTGLTPATFSLSVCIQAGAVTGLDAEQSFALLVTMWNVTGNQILDPGTWAQTALLSNSSSTSYELNSVCSGTVVQHLKPLSVIALYAKAADPGLVPGPDVFTLKRGALMTFGATPVGCSGCTVNININTTYNSTKLAPGHCMAFTYPNTSTTQIDSTGVCSIGSTSSCLTYTNNNGNVSTAFEGMCGVLDTPTVTWTQPSPGVFAATANVTQLLRAGRCMALSNPSPNITQIDSTGLCSIGSTSSCLTFTNTNGSVSTAFAGMCGVLDTPTVTWTQPSPGVFSATASGVSSCASCDANGTLNVQKLCASTQCQVKSDPPSSSNPSPTPQLCFTCGGDGGGSGGGGDSGGGPPIVPIVPIILLPPPFFPPIIPPFVPISGSSGGSGSGGGGDHGPSPLPITTPTPMGIIPANITGGTFIPVVNFSVAVPFCGNVTFGWEVIDKSALPSTLYICEQAFNGSYVWQPYCPCSSALTNGTVWYYKTSIIMGQNATLFADNTTQWINEGYTYLDTLYANHVIINGSLDFCPLNASQPLHTNEIASCNGGQVRFPVGVIIDGNATFTGTTNLNITVNATSLAGGSTSSWTNNGTTTLNGPTTVTGAFTAANLAMCNNGELRGRYLRGCLAAPIADTGLSICNASHAIPFTFDSASNCLGGPPDFPNGITANGIAPVTSTTCTGAASCSITAGVLSVAVPTSVTSTTCTGAASCSISGGVLTVAVPTFASSVTSASVSFVSFNTGAGTGATLAFLGGTTKSSAAGLISTFVLSFTTGTSPQVQSTIAIVDLGVNAPGQWVCSYSRGFGTGNPVPIDITIVNVCAPNCSQMTMFSGATALGASSVNGIIRATCIGF